METGGWVWAFMGLRGALTFLLPALIPATAYTFLQVRLLKKERQFLKITEVLGLGDEAGRAASSLVREEYSPRDYLLPASFLTLLCFVGFFAFFFDQELLQSNLKAREIFLMGILEKPLNDDAHALYLRQQGLVAITMAFIGAFVWSGQNIIRRLIAGDLAPSTYFSASIRIIYSVLIALILVFLIRSVDALNAMADLIPVLAFLTGLTPERALRFIQDRTLFKPSDEASADALPLNMIEGINSFHRYRLSEVSIDNAQNLAHANFIDLLLKTPYNPTQLIDWIAQANLYCYFKHDIADLRRIGIRNAFDFCAASEREEDMEAVAEQSGLNAVTLRLVAGQLRSDPAICQLREYRERLAVLR
ncbi:MAG: hypothetical protein ACPGU7_14005 [Gammaproteobacteria bacterium]